MKSWEFDELALLFSVQASDFVEAREAGRFCLVFASDAPKSEAVWMGRSGRE